MSVFNVWLAPRRSSAIVVDSARAVAPVRHEMRKRSGATNRRTEVKRRAVELS